MKRTQLSLSSFQIHTPAFINNNTIELIIETTLPDEQRAKKSLPMEVIPEPQWNRKLPQKVDKSKVENSGKLGPGGSNEEVKIYRNTNCIDIKGSGGRNRCTGDLP